MKTIDKLSLKLATTGIGSLPHHNIDSALEFSFKMGLPFLPQIPIRNPWEFMIGSALEGLPGLQVERDGAVNLNIDIWKSQSHFMDHRLEQAFSQWPEKKEAFELFEPSAATYSCWQPFLWELQERDLKTAKIQIAGPMTCQWALKIKDGSSPDKHPDLSTQIFRLVLARALAMVNRMISCGIQPILFLDEPGLYALSLNNPKHMICIQELRLMIQTLQKAGAWVGLHCCSNTKWEAVFGLGLDFVSIDTALSLHSALATHHGKDVKNFVSSGGRFSFGVIPTTRSSVLQSLNAKGLASELKQTLSQTEEVSPHWIKKVLNEALYTPACGLAFQSASDAEIILEKLIETYKEIGLD